MIKLAGGDEASSTFATSNIFTDAEMASLHGFAPSSRRLRALGAFPGGIHIGDAVVASVEIIQEHINWSLVCLSKLNLSAAVVL